MLAMLSDLNLLSVYSILCRDAPNMLKNLPIIRIPSRTSQNLSLLFFNKIPPIILKLFRSNSK